MTGQVGEVGVASSQRGGGDSLLALLPSRLAHRLSRAELWSSSELGFSTRIRLMSSTPKCSSRASSDGREVGVGRG